MGERHEGGWCPVKKLQVRKTGPVRLTSVMTPFYAGGNCLT
jgi:hypothetical protein